MEVISTILINCLCSYREILILSFKLIDLVWPYMTSGSRLLKSVYRLRYQNFNFYIRIDKFLCWPFLTPVDLRSPLFSNKIKLLFKYLFCSFKLKTVNGELSLKEPTTKASFWFYFTKNCHESRVFAHLAPDDSMLPQRS